jgi:hypothetical protein
MSSTASVTATAADWPLSADHLRDHHTLFPLIEPFLSPDLHRKCVDSLYGDRTSRHHVGVCRRVLGLDAFTRLKSCPGCRREDRKRYGEAYFHCVHQVPGVVRCPHHGCVLQEVDITAEPEFYTALDEVTCFRPLRVYAGERPLQHNIALDLLALLKFPGLPGSATPLVPQHVVQRACRATPGRDASPLFSLVSRAAAMGSPLSATVNTTTRDGSDPVIITDAQWLRRARQFLPFRVHELKSMYRRRIASLTLKRELQMRYRARLPAPEFIPQTAAYISSFVETKAEAAERVASVAIDQEEVQKAA